MLRVVRWTFVVLGTLFLARAGVTIFHTPRQEVLYAVGQPMRTCVPQVCTTILLLEVGNTGSEEQHNVRVRLRSAPLRDLKLPLTVRNFGKVERPVKVTEAEGELVYELGRLEPQKRVEMKVVYFGKAGEATPTWDDILVAVELDAGAARPGDPSLLQFARFMHAIFGWL